MPAYLPELLCPAGDEEALRAAVDCGANAVYLGYKAFGARASAVNFDEEALERAVRYAHLHHVRVHVTVNTLIKPAELEGVHQALSAIEGCGADAVIVQDLGVAAMVRRDHPRLHLHASTQMALCNAEGARFAKRFGFDRVVLARECSLAEIRAACQTGVEIEVFAHGALCTAVSGRCLMSSMSGGRSGNRGRCAQPCRQCLSLNGQEGPLLSLRDLCVLDELPALCEAGVASLKIEGRLKSAEYVATVASVYRRALDGIANGSFRPNNTAEKERLLQIYNRGGFTRGHAFSAEDAELVTPKRVSHEGLALGEILSVRRDLALLRVDRDLNDGDSLQLRGERDEDLRYSGHDVSSGGTATLRLRPGLHAFAGMQVARLSDARQLEEARAHKPSPIPVRMVGRFALGQPMELTVTDGETSVCAKGSIVEKAQKRASASADAVRQLEKLGGTPFAAVHIQAVVDDGVFLPVSALNALRRDALEQLADARIRAFATQPIARAIPAPLSRIQSDTVRPDTLALIFSDASLAAPLTEAGCTLPFFAPYTFTPEALADVLPTLPDGVWLRLPPQLTQAALDSTLPIIASHAARLGGVVAESVSQLSLPLELPILAGEGVPVVNAEGLKVVSDMGVSGFILWPEWTFAEQQGVRGAPLPRLLKMYGRETLMLLNHCPERVRRGLSSERAACRLCRTPSMVCGREGSVMTDRRGYRFPLARTRFPEGCEIEVLGALPTDLRAYDTDRRALNAGMLLHFTVETAQEQLALTRAYAALLRGEALPAPAFETTSGHWARGVE